MSRSVSDAFIAAVNSQVSDEGFLICITIIHPSLVAPLYLVNNSTNVVRIIDEEEITFLACPIQPTLSDDGDDRPPQAKLVMDNIDRTIIAALRSINSPPAVKLELIKISDVNTVEAELTDFQMREINYNLLTIEATLTLEGIFSEPAIGFSFTPTFFPGLY